ncbi:MAG: hypothetical protein H8K08_14130 [Nitrospira sp.]|nr:hypothetical protein [Nitrospira sp.]
MRHNQLMLTALLSLLAIYLPSHATAAVMEFAFEGTVDGVGLPVFGLNPAIGTAVTGSFSYDTALTVLPTTTFSTHYQISSPYTLVTYIGGTRIESGGSFGISVVNNFNGNIEDQIVIGKQPVMVSGNQTVDGVFSLDLASRNPNTFTSLSLPEQLILNDFDAWRYGVLTRSGNNQEIITFSIDRLTPVPLPGTWLMLVSGLGIIALAAHSPLRIAKASTAFQSTCLAIRR